MNVQLQKELVHLIYCMAERAQRFYVILQNLYHYLQYYSFEYKSKKKRHFCFHMLQCNRKRKIEFVITSLITLFTTIKNI